MTNHRGLFCRFMQCNVKFIVTSLLTVLMTLQAFGETPADSVKVYFRIGQGMFNPSIGNNREAMDRFIEVVRNANTANDIDSIVVRAYASPDGPTQTNIRLARQRSKTVADIIAQRAEINPDIIYPIPGGIAWNELRRIVAVTPEVPSQQKVLDILDNVPEWVYDANGRIIDSRKKQIMNLAGGRPYKWMYDNLFPQLRNAAAVSLYLKSAALDSQTTSDAPDNAPESEASDLSVATEAEVTTEIEEITDSDSAVQTIQPAESSADLADSKRSSDNQYRFALKTNLLYDAALLPNLELQWLINPSWSVALEGGVAWWKNDSKHKYYQLAYVTPEVRYHIRNSAPLHGMYVGLFAGGGLYDLENGHNGYRGEGGLTGLSFGYMWPISRHLSLEAAVGAGYLYTRYKEYEPRDGHYLYMRTKSLNYFGPLKLKFAIAWRFGAVAKPQQPNPAL